MALTPAKLFKEYSDLVTLLESRGMNIPDKARAERKISQVGYYRLSGFWYPSRKIKYDDSHAVIMLNGKPKRSNNFIDNTNFDDIFSLYIFDKRLRLLLLDAIERIEINLKTILAHELGRNDAMAYQKSEYINPNQQNDYIHKGVTRNAWKEWLHRQKEELSRCKEDSILWHTSNNREIPIWVAVEAWSFGTLSKYFELLKGKHQNKIAQRLGVSNIKLLIRWLQEINILRNRCAHHTRVWNQSQNNPIGIPMGNSVDAVYFSQFNLTTDQRKKIYSLIILIWFLVKKIGPNSNWNLDLIQEIKTLPPLPFCPLSAMGIPKSKPLLDKFSKA